MADRPFTLADVTDAVKLLNANKADEVIVRYNGEALTAVILPSAFDDTGAVDVERIAGAVRDALLMAGGYDFELDEAVECEIRSGDRFVQFRAIQRFEFDVEI